MLLVESKRISLPYGQVDKLKRRMYIDRKLKNLSTKIRKLIKYFYYTKHQGIHNPHGQTAVVNLSGSLLNKDMGRYAFVICQILKFSGFQLIVKVDPDFFAGNTPYKRMLSNQGFKLVRSTGLKSDSISFHVQKRKKKVLGLVYGNIAPQHHPSSYPLPYPLHPRFYQEHLKPSYFETFQQQQRTTRIIFSGNFDRKLYSKPLLKERFPGTISRVEALDHILSGHASDPRIVRSTTKEDLYRRLELKPVAQQFIISEARTPDEDWLSILSKGDFYLCLPGVRMPWSHNAIESMAVGTIPILQYDALFYPPLEHLKNCISYHDYASLDDAIQTALAMDVLQVQQMKAAVLDYYNQHLATDQTIKRIQDFAHSAEENMLVGLPFLEKNA
jgi:hypothetical protein